MNERMPYRTPSLSVFGPVAELTQQDLGGDDCNTAPGKLDTGEDSCTHCSRIESIDGPAMP